MVEPTIKDVLDAIVRLEKGQATLEKGQATLEKGQAALGSDLASHRLETAHGFADIARNVADHRRETKDGFAALDSVLQGHADPLHRSLEKDIEKLKKDVEALKAHPRPAARSARRR
jgi:hypothetical protein